MIKGERYALSLFVSFVYDIRLYHTVMQRGTPTEHVAFWEISGIFTVLSFKLLYIFILLSSPSLLHHSICLCPP